MGFLAGPGSSERKLVTSGMSALTSKGNDKHAFTMAYEEVSSKMIDVLDESYIPLIDCRAKKVVLVCLGCYEEHRLLSILPHCFGIASEASGTLRHMTGIRS